MYEVELKVEITEKEKEALIQAFKEKGFTAKGMTPQNDFYIEAKASPHGGYDLKRYRQEGDKFIYTEKIWEVVGDTPARRENEHEISEDLFNSEISKFPEAVKIKKDREWFEGSFQDTDISITIDNVKFDHSPAMRYFIEAEVDVENINSVKETKRMIVNFLANLLGKTDEIMEAPGMFMMAFKKL